jgi:hypothetical protein
VAKIKRIIVCHVTFNKHDFFSSIHQIRRSSSSSRLNLLLLLLTFPPLPTVYLPPSLLTGSATTYNLFPPSLSSLLDGIFASVQTFYQVVKVIEPQGLRYST